jgi:hypothetical protein
MKNVIENKINEVRNNFPTIYTQEDVIKILTSMESEIQEPKSNINFDDLKDDILSKFSRKLNNCDSENIVDFSSAEFEINYNNQVELCTVSIDSDYIEGVLEEVLSEMKEEQEFDENGPE